MTAEQKAFQGSMKLKTLLMGTSQEQNDLASEPGPSVTAPRTFPANVLAHQDAFIFLQVANFEEALQIIANDRDIDLVFMDADLYTIPELTMFMSQARERRAKIPIVIFTGAADDKMRYLMREGASWHFTKSSPAIDHLAEQVHRHVFAPVDWDELFAQYLNDNVKPRIEPGLSFTDLDALRQNPEERYIIKRLFANSDVVQIFRMDEGFSGSRIYTVKPSHQLKLILKIEVADRMEMVQYKQEHIVQPRLNRRVGQIQGKMVRAQHMAGACYTLAGSSDEAITLNQFLQDQNQVRKELIDRILHQLRVSMEQLYAGSSDTELRYWAPLYSRILPTHLLLDEAVLVESDEVTADFTLSAETLTTLSAVPNNPTLQAINTAVRNGQQPTVILQGFEVAELDTRQGVLYLHDDIVARQPLSSLLDDKSHPLLRFRVRLTAEQRYLLTHPIFRRGKRIDIYGVVTETQETILANAIADLTERPYDFDDSSFELFSGRFIAPIANLRYLLWEIGREDMIVPIPQISPVVHGDLNTTNVLIETSDEVPLWLIDFSDARPGHVYFDLAKLEVEFRTHVFYRLFQEMVDDELWDKDTAIRFTLMLENVLLEKAAAPFDAFIAELRDYVPEWYDAIYSQYPLYFENLLYFLHSLRRIAEAYNSERFRYHYPVAVFFQSMAALKYKSLDETPRTPWAKWLALCCALVHGKQAVQRVERPYEIMQVLGGLRQRSAFALITIGTGEDRKYLLQWNDNWGMFNLVGGKIDNEKGDRDSFARSIQRKMQEELGLRSPKDYRILRELPPLQKRQFSRREFVFKEYEFHLFHIEFLPRHPHTVEEFDRFAARLASQEANLLVSRAEIERLRTNDGRPISETTRMILQDLGEIDTTHDEESLTTLEIRWESENVRVSRGRAELLGILINPGYSSLVENITLEVLPTPTYDAELDSAVVRIESLDPGEEARLDVWIQPKAMATTLNIRLTYYDVRGKEYRQLLEQPITFENTGQLSHISNPYVVGKPLTAKSESLFVGRSDVFRWIEENLVGKTQPHTLVLYGQRRMGKTSTLYQLIGGQRGQTIRNYPGYPIFPVYIDLQRLASSNTGEFLTRISQQVVRDLGRRDIEISLPESANNVGPYQAFDTFMDQVDERLPENGLLVIVMDELEQLRESVHNGRLNPEILPYLRSLIQHRNQMAFILSGTNQLLEAYWSSVFQVSISREIPSLARPEVESLVRTPVAPMIQYDDLAVEQIWLATRGHPYFVQLICHRLISTTNLGERRSKMITLTDVRQTLAQIIQEDDSHLQQLWHECSPQARLVLSLLASNHEVGQEIVSRAEIIEQLPGVGLDQESINKLLEELEVRRLVERQVIERHVPSRLERPNGMRPALVSKDYMYAISFSLLSKWIAHKRTLASLL
jgi:CheY-like chemotaxis protein